MRHDVDMSAAVFPAMASKYSSSVRSVENSERTSASCPSHSRAEGVGQQRGDFVPSEAAISAELASRKSPATMATRLPHRAFTLSTLRRMVASSMTSSW